MTANDPATVATQYTTDQHLRTRQQAHIRYSSGPGLEEAVDAVLGLEGSEALLDVGTGPGDYPGRLRADGHTGPLAGVDLSAGMVGRARQQYPGVVFVQASADALPFDDGPFDVLTARHMLYHVPSVPAALSEFRRVLKPGGRFLAVTNAARYMAELWDAVAEATERESALKAVRASRGSYADAFSETNGEAWIREAFGNVQVEFTDSVLLFPAVEPVLTYLESLPVWQGLDEGERSRSSAALKEVLAPQFESGSWRVSKRLVLLKAVRD
ncbi:class I SAM-dependent methyltransferase [Deinococcus sp.]|uniref:class I SAM-dependent methyltransferase n=1 Tax=Deinococcus sp. TaxID=47478 RepID=UPI003B5B1B64